MEILAEVVKVFDIKPFNLSGGDSFRFRLEITRNINTGNHNGIVYRLETYRLQPTFPQTENGRVPRHKHDALVYVYDDSFGAVDLSGKSVNDVIEKFEAAFNRFFCIDLD